jgi:hypothetical protein
MFFSGSLGIIKVWAWKLDEGRRSSCGLRGIKNSYRNYNRMSKEEGGSAGVKREQSFRMMRAKMMFLVRMVEARDMKGGLYGLFGEGAGRKGHGARAKCPTVRNT